jgi:hypothetical protein
MKRGLAVGMMPALLALLFLEAGCAPAGADPSVRARLAHPDPAERLSALSALDRQGDPLAEDALLRLALGDPEPRVRQAAALVLESQTLDSLEHLALKALRRAPDLGLGAGMLASDHEALRTAAIAALQRLDSPAAWTLLARRMPAEPSDGARLLCARALAAGAERGAGPAHGAVLQALRLGLQDPEPGIRDACAKALGQSGDEASVGALIDALARAEPAARPEWIRILRTATGEDLGDEPEGWIFRYGRQG